MSKKKEKDPAVVRKNRADVAKALEILFADDYISRRRLYAENFVRGMFFAIGGVIGATFVLGIVIWFLGLFDQIPLLGPVIDSFRDTIEKGSTVR